MPLTTIYPDESGLDDSPKHDAVFGWMRHDSSGHGWLVERDRRPGYDARAITERYDEHLEDVLVTVFYALGLRANRPVLRPRRPRRATRARVDLVGAGPTGADRELAFNPRFALWRCWRGPSWMNAAWLEPSAGRRMMQP